MEDTILLKLSIRHPTYHQKCLDMQSYINELKRSLKEKDKEKERASEKEKRSEAQVRMTLLTLMLI